MEKSPLAPLFKRGGWSAPLQRRVGSRGWMLTATFNLVRFENYTFV